MRDPSEPTNEQRAAWGAAAIEGSPDAIDYTEAGQLEPEYAVADLICDLHHFCDHNGLSWDDILERAQGHHRAETEGER
jgi:hypothetical protein